MTVADLRTTDAGPTQKRKFATVPLKREPLTQRLSRAALNRRGTIADATVSGLRWSYALNRRLSAPRTCAALRYLGHSAVSGVLGCTILVLTVEAAFRFEQRKRRPVSKTALKLGEGS